MDEQLETLVIGVRADTSGFARDVAGMKAELEGPLADGLARAGRAIEGALVGAIRTGRVSFEDLRRVALSVVSDIARAAIHAGIGALTGGGSGGGGGGGGNWGGIAASLAGALLGLPGRATGGPVSGGRGYIVGEHGPELFVPTASGRVETLGPRGGARDVRITVNLNGAGTEPERMARSGRQVARAVRAALIRAES